MSVFYYTPVEELVERAEMMRLRPADLKDVCGVTQSSMCRVFSGLTKPRRDVHEKMERFVLNNERIMFDALLKLPHIRARLAELDDAKP